MMGPRMGMGPDGFGPRHLLGRGPGEYLSFCVGSCSVAALMSPMPLYKYCCRGIPVTTEQVT